MRPSLFAVALLAVASAAAGPACRGRSDAERRASENATTIAEERAQETTLTGATATIERSEDARDGEVKRQEARANDEIVAAFRLEQSDFRGRLRRALDALDKTIAEVRQAPARRADGGARDLRARRDLLKADLEALDRSTEQDWATVRTKVDRDLRAGQH